MKKVVLILAIAMMWSAHAQAADRDCVKYSASEAISATNTDNNTFSATFSGVAERKGNSNADCTAGSTILEEDENEPEDLEEDENEPEEETGLEEDENEPEEETGRSHGYNRQHTGGGN